MSPFKIDNKTMFIRRHSAPRIKIALMITLFHRPYLRKQFITTLTLIAFRAAKLNITIQTSHGALHAESEIDVYVEVNTAGNQHTSAGRYFSS